VTDKDLAGLYPAADGLQRRTPEKHDRVKWEGRAGEALPGGSLGTVIVTAGGVVTVQFDYGGLATATAEKFSPLTTPAGAIIKAGTECQ